MKLALLSPMHHTAPTASPTPLTGGTLASQKPDAFTPSTKLQRQGFNLSKGNGVAKKQAKMVAKTIEKALKISKEDCTKELEELLGHDYRTHCQNLNSTLAAVKIFIKAPTKKNMPKSMYLRGLDLRETILRQANLLNADLTGAILREANLLNADLTGANLTRANLTGANLKEANLTGANLTGAKLQGAKLTKADLTDAILTKQYILENGLHVEGIDYTWDEEDFLKWVELHPNTPWPY